MYMGTVLEHLMVPAWLTSLGNESLLSVGAWLGVTDALGSMMSRNAVSQVGEESKYMRCRSELLGGCEVLRQQDFQDSSTEEE